MRMFKRFKHRPYLSHTAKVIKILIFINLILISL